MTAEGEFHNRYTSAVYCLFTESVPTLLEFVFVDLAAREALPKDIERCLAGRRVP